VRDTAREAVMNLIIHLIEYTESGSTAWFDGPHTCNVRGRQRASTHKKESRVSDSPIDKTLPIITGRPALAE
jgi:hypothetical protein